MPLGGMPSGAAPLVRPAFMYFCLFENWVAVVERTRGQQILFEHLIIYAIRGPFPHFDCCDNTCKYTL